METKQRAELHLHTDMSTLDGVSNIDKYIEAAAEFGLSAIAVTDHAVAHSFPDAYKASEKYGIKVIYGMEGYLVNHPLDGALYHISILVKNKKGLKNLYKLISKSHIEYLNKQPLILRSELIKYRDGLILGSACAHGELFRAALDGKKRDELARIADFYDYLEIQPIGNHRFLIDSDITSAENLLKINKKIIKIGECINKPVVATGDVHYAYPEEKICREIVIKQCSGEGRDMLSDLHLKNTEEMLEEFLYLGKEKAYEIVVENSNRIADLTEDGFAPFSNELHLPEVENSDEIIRAAAYDGMKRLYGQNPPKFVKDRLNREIEIIIEGNNSYLFVIAKKLAEGSLKDGYIVSNRGCVSASLTAFFLGITEINPLVPHYVCGKCYYTELHPQEFCGPDMKNKVCPNCGNALQKDGFDIPMETFFGADGHKVPDIDLTFSEQVLNNVVEALKEMFGDKNIVGYGTVETVYNAIASHWVEDYCSKNKIELLQEQKDEIINAIGSVKRATGRYPGAWFIIPEHADVYEYTPVNYANNYAESPIVTHFSGLDLSGCLKKIDILGQYESTVLKQLYDKTGINPVNILLDDEKTLKLICNGDTDSVPEFNSEYSKGLIKALTPLSFDDLIRISGLSHGAVVWNNNAEKLIKQGQSLKEIITCRDDIMNYLIKRGIDRKEAYSIMDNARRFRTINDKQKSLMRSVNVPDWYIDSCCKIEYMFSRAHCAARTLISFRIAYYKAHFRAEFDEVINGIDV